MTSRSRSIAVDPLFPPPENYSLKKSVVNDITPENKFQMIFDERVDGEELEELMKEKNNVIVETDEEEMDNSEGEDQNEEN